MNTVRRILFLILAFSFSQLAQGKDYRLTSPNGKLVVTVHADATLSYSVVLDGQPIVNNSAVGLTLNKQELPANVLKSENKPVNQDINVDVPRKKAVLKDQFNQLTLKMKGNYAVSFRAYDYGMAYRFETSRKEPIEVNAEKTELNFAGEVVSWFPEEESMMSHNERIYKKLSLKEIGQSRFCSLPVRFQTAAGTHMLFTEADVADYPCMFLYKSGDNSLHAQFPKHVLEIKIPERGGDRSEIISKEADCIAKTSGTRTFPWRVLYVTNNNADFFEHDLVYQLSRPSVLQDASWIKPGKVAWDWWNANNIRGVDFKSGINTETYKYYIDFASRYGLPYIMLDEGWTKTTTIVKESTPDIDIKELVRYGKEKNVDVLLWLLWKPLDQDMDAILDLYKSWGIKGIKVDFMQRSDQYMVNYLERVAAATAKRQMMVDFHGIFKPTGLHRTYPNVISNEGVRGMENCKWEKNITPSHDVTLPFIRMVAGPMDFTPGAMDNAQPQNFFTRFERPMSQGTRCHQVAMYVIYESPLQMLADNPSNYYREKESAEFISKIPTTWDDTRFLAGETGEYIVLARKNGNSWYIGAMSNEQARELKLDLSFLGDGQYTAEVMQDGVNADRNAEDYKKVSQPVKAGEPLTVKLAPGGGWAAIITKK